MAWGRFEDDEDDIYRRQPQLGQVLRTTFDALLVGYSREACTPLALVRAAPVQRVPAMPPRLHALVYAATPDRGDRLQRRSDLPALRAAHAPPHADDFIAAAIGHAYRAGGDDRAFLVAAARTVARLLGAEHERVMNILELLDD